MKRIIFIRTIITIITLSLIITMASGCRQSDSDISGRVEDDKQDSGHEETKPDKGETQGEEGTPAEVDPSAEIKSEFGTIEKSVENIEVIFDFIDENIADSNPELASDMVCTVMKLCEDYREIFAGKFSDPDITGNIYALSSKVIVDGVLDLEALRNIDNEKVRDVIEEAISKRYKLITIEGMIEPLVDYGAYQIYIPYVGVEMKDYLDIKTDESEKPFVMDAEVTISSKDFVERIIKSMEYIKNYPYSPRADEIMQLKDRMLWIYLGGVDNSRVFGEDGKIFDEKLDEFEEMLERYSGTEFGEILASYLELLEEENYKRTEKVDEFINDIYEI